MVIPKKFGWTVYRYGVVRRLWAAAFNKVSSVALSILEVLQNGNGNGIIIARGKQTDYGRNKPWIQEPTTSILPPSRQPMTANIHVPKKCCGGFILTWWPSMAQVTAMCSICTVSLLTISKEALSILPAAGTKSYASGTYFIIRRFLKPLLL